MPATEDDGPGPEELGKQPDVGDLDEPRGSREIRAEPHQPRVGPARLIAPHSAAQDAGRGYELPDDARYHGRAAGGAIARQDGRVDEKDFTQPGAEIGGHGRRDSGHARGTSGQQPSPAPACSIIEHADPLREPRIIGEIEIIRVVVQTETRNDVGIAPVGSNGPAASTTTSGAALKSASGSARRSSARCLQQSCSASALALPGLRPAITTSWPSRTRSSASRGQRRRSRRGRRPSFHEPRTQRRIGNAAHVDASEEPVPVTG